MPESRHDDALHDPLGVRVTVYRSDPSELQPHEGVRELPFPVAFPMQYALSGNALARDRIDNGIFAVYQGVRLVAVSMLAIAVRYRLTSPELSSAVAALSHGQFGSWSAVARAAAMRLSVERRNYAHRPLAEALVDGWELVAGSGPSAGCFAADMRLGSRSADGVDALGELISLRNDRAHRMATVTSRRHRDDRRRAESVVALALAVVRRLFVTPGLSLVPDGQPDARTVTGPCASTESDPGPLGLCLRGRGETWMDLSPFVFSAQALCATSPSGDTRPETVYLADEIRDTRTVYLGVHGPLAVAQGTVRRLLDELRAARTGDGDLDPDAIVLACTLHGDLHERQWEDAAARHDRGRALRRHDLERTARKVLRQGGKGLLVTGATGAGKTHFVRTLFVRLRSEGMLGVYLTRAMLEPPRKRSVEEELRGLVERALGNPDALAADLEKSGLPAALALARLLSNKEAQAAQAEKGLRHALSAATGAPECESLVSFVESLDRVLQPIGRTLLIVVDGWEEHPLHDELLSQLASLSEMLGRCSSLRLVVVTRSTTVARRRDGERAQGAWYEREEESDPFGRPSPGSRAYFEIPPLTMAERRELLAWHLPVEAIPDRQLRLATSPWLATELARRLNKKRGGAPETESDTRARYGRTTRLALDALTEAYALAVWAADAKRARGLPLHPDTAEPLVLEELVTPTSTYDDDAPRYVATQPWLVGELLAKRWLRERSMPLRAIVERALGFARDGHATSEVVVVGIERVAQRWVERGRAAELLEPLFAHATPPLQARVLQSVAPVLGQGGVASSRLASALMSFLASDEGEATQPRARSVAHALEPLVRSLAATGASAALREIGQARLRALEIAAGWDGQSHLVDPTLDLGEWAEQQRMMAMGADDQADRLHRIAQVLESKPPPLATAETFELAVVLGMSDAAPVRPAPHDAASGLRRARELLLALDAREPSARTSIALAVVESKLAARTAGRPTESEQSALFEAARTRLLALLEREPDNVSAMRCLAVTLGARGTQLLRDGEHAEATGHLQSAVHTLERLVRAHPENPAFERDLATNTNYLARAKVRLGATEEARTLFEAGTSRMKRLTDEFPTHKDYRKGYAAALFYALDALPRDSEAWSAMRRACIDAYAEAGEPDPETHVEQRLRGAG